MTACHNRLAVPCILLAMVLAKSALTSSSECGIEYVIQPSSAPANCSPYSVSNTSNSSVLIVTLECAVRKQSEGFEIRWFRENMTGGVEELGRGSTETICGDSVSSRYHDRDLLDQQYSPSLLGKYWCQVINTTSDPDQPLMRSSVFTLLAPGDYNGTACPTVQALANATCADLPSNSTQPLASNSTQPLASISTQPLTSISKPALVTHTTTAGNCITTTILPSSTHTQQLPSAAIPMPSSTVSLNPANAVASVGIIVGIGVTIIIIVVTVCMTVALIIIVKVCFKKKKEDEDDYMTMNNNMRVQSSTRSELNPYDVYYFKSTISESSSVTTQTNPSFKRKETSPPPPPPGDGDDNRSQDSDEYASMDTMAKKNLDVKILLDQQSTTEEPEYQNMHTIDQTTSDAQDTPHYQPLNINTSEYVSVYTTATMTRKWKTSSEDLGYAYGTL